MNNLERLQQIEQRLQMLDVLNANINKIIVMLEDMARVKRNIEPTVTFKSANNNNRDGELKAREREIFKMLDNVK